MAAAVLKGLIISISIITALGIAVLENPQIQVWLEEQRRRIAELLRSIGEDLDPESRRQAEAFAYEGRTPATDVGLRRELSGSREAAALATGRSMSGSSSTVRRIPVRGPSDPDEAEERRRKGREYLAQRNQHMYELQQRRKGANADGAATPPTPTSFDAIVDGEGKLKDGESEDGRIMMTDKTMPSPPTIEPVPVRIQEQMREVERHLVQPLLAGESSSSSEGYRTGSVFANPFGDEYALERSETPRPRPPVPPKIQLDEVMSDIPAMPGSYTPASIEHIEPRPEPSEADAEELTYEEQLAIALSLSEAEGANPAVVRQWQPDQDDDDLKAAIEASLREMDGQQAAHAVAHAKPLTPRPLPADMQPLVDLTPPSPRVSRDEPETRREWETLFDPRFSPSQEPLTLNEPAPSEATDELYRITPELTRARLATFDAQSQVPPSGASEQSYDPVREAAESHTMSPQPAPAMDSSFYSAPSSIAPPHSESTLDHEAPQLIDANDVPLLQPAPATTGFRSDSDSETFASLSRPTSPAESRTLSELSEIEVLDVDEDSDVDILSEEGNGIATPDSWTEVGSRDGDSDMSDGEQHSQHRPNL